MASPGAGVPVPTAFDNTSAWAWSNLPSWTAQHLPSLEDLVLAGPRMLTKIGSIISFSDAAATADAGYGQHLIPAATASLDHYLTTADTTSSMTSLVREAATEAAAAAAAAAAIDDEMRQDPAAFASRFSVEGAKGLGSVFSYLTSKWAICCCVMAIVLNRTHIFAASRRRLRLRWHVRLALRFLPIALFLYQAQRFLQSIQCQTSPDFAEMRWGNSSKSSDLMFAQPVGYLHTLSSMLLLGAHDIDSCRAVQMVPQSESVYPAELQGSLSLLWPLYATFCLSHFVETISCAVQGRPVAVETGMTLFEHSLAFAEADAAIGNQLGWGLFSGPSSSNLTFKQGSGTSFAISRSMIMKRVNTPPEVLLVAFFSAMSHVTSHVLDVFGLQSKMRLISTGFWALCFMSSIILEAVSFSLEDPSTMGLFRFPTVCIIGFIPHVMVLSGILVCLVIYGIALVLSALASPSGAVNGRRLTFRERLVEAHGNMQANISLSDIRISWEMDFYTALLRTGFGVITMASEAVYLNEDQGVTLKERTWLEDERYRELESLRMTGSRMGPPYDSVGTIGLVPIKETEIGATSGYARERAAQKIPKTRMGDKRPRDGNGAPGVGASERSSRWMLALEFLMNINRLIMRWGALIMLKGLARIGVRARPRLLVWLTSRPKMGRRDERQSGDGSGGVQVSGRSKNASLFNDEIADVEATVRRRLKSSPETANLPDEEVDRRLYTSWKLGGLWGATDTSGEWKPAEDADDWDTTSMIYSVAGSDADENEDRDLWEDDDDQLDDGQRTPTQVSPFASREATPLDHPLPMADLARLLHPNSPEERQEAHALAAHLRSDKILTRSQYAREQTSARTRLLLSSRRPHASHHKLTPEEEAELLEQLILARRTGPPAQQDQIGAGEDAGSWAESGVNGPPCVVCHTTPRTVIVWPCRCLSLCDECRVSLAMNNFDKCVCCRREVISFSKIYVP